MILQNPSKAASKWRVIGQISFYFASCALLTLMTWLLPQSYIQPKISTIVPNDMAEDKVLDYIKSFNKSERASLILQQKQNFLNEPLDRFSLLNLSVLLGIEGDSDESNVLVLAVANRSLRDLSAQIAAANLSFSQKNYADVLMRLDGLLRSRPDFSKTLFPFVLEVTSTPDGMTAVVKQLALNPPWRLDFINFVTKDSNQKSVIYSLFSDLRKMNAEITTGELRTYLNALMTDKNYEKAYFVWLDFLSSMELRKVGLIYDGGFDFPPHNLNYGWNLNPGANVDIGTAVRPGKANDSALKLVFVGLKGSFLGVSQYLRLDPGKYALSLEYMASALQTPVGLQWRVACVEGTNEISRGEAIGQNTLWTTYKMDISVPVDSCATQLLVLTWSSPATLDQLISGQLWFDNFNLQKTD